MSEAIPQEAALLETMERFRADPGSARTRPEVNAVLAGGRGRLTGGPFTWETDLPPIVGGGNVYPSPVAYLLGALAGCAVVLIHDTLAPQLGVEVDGVSAVASCESDLRGVLGMDGADPRLTGLRIDITIDSPAPADRVAELQNTWLDRCPILLALFDAADVEVGWHSGSSRATR